jgi:hypothetical protein
VKKTDFSFASSLLVQRVENQASDQHTLLRRKTLRQIAESLREP